MVNNEMTIFILKFLLIQPRHVLQRAKNVSSCDYFSVMAFCNGVNYHLPYAFNFSW